MKTTEEKAREHADKVMSDADWTDIQYMSEYGRAEEDFAKTFIAGAAYALGNQWRDVREEMPPSGKDILVLCEYGCCVCCQCPDDKVWLMNNSNVEPKAITHWMPIPELPIPDTAEK